VTLRRTTPERLSTFSDAVFAVLITVLVLELRPPDIPTYQALLTHWPIWLSYAMSYLFIAIVWMSHHYLMRYATEPSPRLMWITFGHLFSVSLVPLSTAWMAKSAFAPQAVSFYAAVFCLVNATYVSLIRELVEPTSSDEAARNLRRRMLARALATLGVFALATVVALRFPLVALGLTSICLVAYLRPDPPRA